MNDRRRGIPLAAIAVFLVAGFLLPVSHGASASTSTSTSTSTTTTTPAPTSTTRPRPDDTALARDYVARINGRRADLGLAALAVLPQLTTSAQSWTEHQASAKELSHDLYPLDNILGTVAWDMYGENVASGPDNDVIWDALMASPGHYKNIVEPRYTHVGIGVVTDASGRQWTTHRFLHIIPAAPPDAEPLVFEPPPPPVLPVVVVPPTAPPLAAPPTQPASTVPPSTLPVAPPVTAPPAAAPTAASSADPDRVGALLIALQHLHL